MELAGYTAGQWLVLVQHELLLFTGLMFLAGAIDEWAVDLFWLWKKATGKLDTPRLPHGFEESSDADLGAAVFIPAWAEADVIGLTIRHMLAVWPQPSLRIYVGCYPNDPDTLAAASQAAGRDPRVRLVLTEEPGPSTKASCLNRLYRALLDDERRGAAPVACIILHDAEDMVDRAALPLIQAAMGGADFVQLPVLPAPQPVSRWIGSHYCEEFAEAHAKSMPVRDALGASIPSAGVGCGIDRKWLGRLAARRGNSLPFAADSLTEDYELGLTLHEMGADCRFLRVRSASGHLVATRACFPANLSAAVRQKTRWVNGIALHGWDRTGWGRSPSEIWMRVRDRRGPMTAFVTALAYLLLILVAAGQMAAWAGYEEPLQLTPVLRWLLLVNAAALAWRAVFRFAFTAREYGVLEGVRAVGRIPLSNIIAIMAGRRACFAYWRALRGAGVVWDKTDHAGHPSMDDEGRFARGAA